MNDDLENVQQRILKLAFRLKRGEESYFSDLAFVYESVLILKWTAVPEILLFIGT
jgi:hypothetical protein